VLSQVGKEGLVGDGARLSDLLIRDGMKPKSANDATALYANGGNCLLVFAHHFG
jgi:hypothetical protein